jgi:hypothetical protein
VLVPGGRVAVLDFNNSEQPLIDGLQVRGTLQGDQWGHVTLGGLRDSCQGTGRGVCQIDLDCR